MNDDLERVKELREEYTPQWVQDFYHSRCHAALKAGVPPRKVLRALGMDWVLDPVDPDMSDTLVELAELYHSTRFARRTARQKDRLQLLTETALAEGFSKRHVARALECSDGQIRQLLNPDYLTQTPDERAAFKAEQRDRIEMMS